MTEDGLQEIERKANAENSVEAYVPKEWVEGFFRDDVNALIAEVRRLREDYTELAGHYLKLLPQPPLDNLIFRPSDHPHD